MDLDLLSLSRKLQSTDDIPYFTFKGKEIYAYPISVYDGDTFSVVFEYHGEIIKYRCRCYGYDSPEMKPALKNPNRDQEKEQAHLAKNKLAELLHKHPSKLVKMECLDFDKYGRILVNVSNMVDEERVNDLMIKGGFGKPYFGGKKDDFTVNPELTVRIKEATETGKNLLANLKNQLFALDSNRK